jgi:hypothetical protein
MKFFEKLSGGARQKSKEPTKADLYKQAKEMGIKGRSKMSKEELQNALRDFKSPKSRNVDLDDKVFLEKFAVPYIKLIEKFVQVVLKEKKTTNLDAFAVASRFFNGYVEFVINKNPVRKQLKTFWESGHTEKFMHAVGRSLEELPKGKKIRKGVVFDKEVTDMDSQELLVYIRHFVNDHLFSDKDDPIDWKKYVKVTGL